MDDARDRALALKDDDSLDEKIKSAVRSMVVSQENRLHAAIQSDEAMTNAVEDFGRQAVSIAELVRALAGPWGRDLVPHHFECCEYAAKALMRRGLLAAAQG